MSRVANPFLALKEVGIVSVLEMNRYHKRSEMKVAQSSRATKKSVRESPVKLPVLPNKVTGLVSLLFWLIVTTPLLFST